jgi:hypothetical protein
MHVGGHHGQPHQAPGMQPAAVWPRKRHPVLRLKLPALDGAHDYFLVMIMSVGISYHLGCLSILAFCATEPMLHRRRRRPKCGWPAHGVLRRLRRRRGFLDVIIRSNTACAT